MALAAPQGDKKAKCSHYLGPVSISIILIFFMQYILYIIHNFYIYIVYIVYIFYAIYCTREIILCGSY